MPGKQVEKKKGKNGTFGIVKLVAHLSFSLQTEHMLDSVLVCTQRNSEKQSYAASVIALLVMSVA